MGCRLLKDREDVALYCKGNAAGKKVLETDS